MKTPTRIFFHDHCRYADRSIDWIVSTSESVLTLNVTDAPEPPVIGSSDTESDPNNFKVNEIIDDSDIARNVTNNDNVTRFLMA